MKLEEKIFYFYNDFYEFVENLRDLKIISTKTAGIILSKFSRSFHENFGNEERNTQPYNSIGLSEIEGLKNLIISKHEIDESLKRG